MGRLAQKGESKIILTQKRLKRLLYYNQGTGLFIWLIKSSNRIHVGDIAGSLSKNGYTIIKIDGEWYGAHRLAWLYSYGYFPEFGLDHRNGVRNDNALDNLRHTTQPCNMQNQKINSRNKSGFPGVSWYDRDSKWNAQAQLNGKTIALGRYKTALDAALARLTWEIQYTEWTCNYGHWTKNTNTTGGK